MNKKSIIICALVALIAVWLLTAYNGLVRLDEKVEAEWSQVLNQYKRRFDLVNSLVETVRGATDYEGTVLKDVVALRADANKALNVADLATNPEAMAAFQKSQVALSEGLGRLMMVVERYPELKASENFSMLQSQLEGTENRIAVARKDYIEAVRLYNTRIRTIPTAWVAGYMGLERRETFDIAEEEQKRPEIKFR